MVDNHLISIIVPIYNSEKTLEKCILSLLSQTYKNFELLLINDGSSDDSGHICEEYKYKDARIRYFFKANDGVSSARNMGLKAAKGDLVTFVDADDWVSESYLSNLLEEYDKTQTDLVLNYATIVNKDKFERENYPEKTISIAELKDLFFNNDLIWHTSPWSKLYKLDIIRNNNLEFPIRMNIGEDAVFLYSYILNCNSISVICTCDYFYNAYNEGTLTKLTSEFTREKRNRENIFSISNEIFRFCNDERLIPIFGWLKGGYTRRCLNAMYMSKIPLSERRSFLKNGNISDYVNYVSENSTTGKIYKFLLKNRMFLLYDFLRIMIKKIK